MRTLGVELYVDVSSSPIDTVTALALAAAAGAGALAALVIGGWRPGPRSRAPAVALLAGACAWAAADEALALHETLGHNMAFIRAVPGVDHPDDVVLAVYLVMALAGGWWARRRLRLSPAASALLLLAVAMFGMALASDFLHGLEAIEERLELVAAALILAAVLLLAADNVADAFPQALDPRAEVSAGRS